MQMMISSRSGLIRWTVLRETISREALPRPLLRRPIAAPGADFAIGFRLEPLNHVTVVIEARAEQMCEESVRAAAKRCGHLHRVVSRGSVVANGGEALRDIRPPPPHGQARTLRGARRAQGVGGELSS